MGSHMSFFFFPTILTISFSIFLFVFGYTEWIGQQKLEHGGANSF